MRISFFILMILFSTVIFGQVENISSLQISEIMKGKDFIGYWPENVYWNLDGSKIVFDWNPNLDKEMSKHYYDTKTKKTERLKNENSEPEFDAKQQAFTDQYYTENGILCRYDKVQKTKNKILELDKSIFNVQRMNNPNRIAFQLGNDLYLYDHLQASITKLTNFQNESNERKTPQNQQLAEQQKFLFKEYQNEVVPESFSNKIDLAENTIDFLVLSKDEKFLFVGLGKYSENKHTEIAHYVTETGFTKIEKTRSKVGENEPIHQFGIYDFEKKQFAILNFDNLTNIRKKPLFLKEYGDTTTEYLTNRKICFHPTIVSTDNKAVMDIRSYDNKDRWIIQLHPEELSYEEIDIQHDEAWIGGPGISEWNREPATMGYFSKDQKLYYQSEISGFSHLYSYDFRTKIKNQLTSGKFEIHGVLLSKNQSDFYVTCNVTHPGDRGFYKLDPETKKMTELLVKTGAFQVSISPDEKKLAYLFSDKTNPWELFLCENSIANKSIQITKSQSTEFQKYAWTKPKVITFFGTDNLSVYARLFEANETKNKPAVIFVHGAGYLQNAHNYWSNYYREFMFHNLLKDNGITVLDIDYRASEGYGRNYRTAIYRDMGGQDLQDQISGKKFLIDSLGIDPEKVGIYGGSYGGFITLMALLKTPDEFACGAALRSVTDWMHYNHEYTSNILNYPTNDSLAYFRSSPINFAAGLSKPLIMLHGMVDDNVHYQDIVRMSQRFIDLGKMNWELSSYPLESHGFTRINSWVDEYSRIYKLLYINLLSK